MAEMIFQDMINKADLGDSFSVTSRAAIFETTGEDMYAEAKKELIKHDIKILPHTAKQITYKDYMESDYLVGMDNYTLLLVKRAIYLKGNEKLFRLLDFTDRQGDIKDPYGTLNFDKAYQDIYYGCQGFLKYLIKKQEEETSTVNN